MQILYDQNICFQNFSENIVILGNFDGVHLGHVELIKKAKILSAQTGMPVLIMNFSPHPSEFLKKKDSFKYISSLEEKIENMSKLGVDYLFIKEFDKKFSEVSAEDFVSSYLYKLLRARYVIVGDNFLFGHQATGNVENLEKMSEKYDFTLVTEKLFRLSSQKEIVSSSNIRQKLQKGDLAKAAEMLGRDYQLKIKLLKREGGLISAFVELNSALKSGNYYVSLKPKTFVDEDYLRFYYEAQRNYAHLEWRDFLEENTDILVFIKKFIE